MLLFTLLALAPVALGHTWIEQMRNINADGQYVGEYGYPRGYKDKSVAGYNSETDMNYLLPPGTPFIDATHLLCHPNQRKQVQNENFPRLQSMPGGWLALRYAENGHVSNPSTERGHVPNTLDEGRRPNGGSVFVFGTTEPKEDEKIADVLRWTKDGQGGDKRGVLLAVNDYDDGRCYEINPVTQKGRMLEFPNYAHGQAQEGPGGFPLLCETNAQLPTEIDTGKPYTIYWVWQWPFEPEGGVGKKDQYYTTCMDVDIGESIQQSASMQYGLTQQDGQTKASPNWRNRKALITDPIKGNVGPLFDDDNAAPAPSASAPSAPAPSAPAPSSSGTPTTFYSVTTPPAASSTSINDDGIVRVTVTERVTVTATPVPTTAPFMNSTSNPPVKRADHVARHGTRKFRGMSRD